MEVVYPLVRRIGCIARSAPGFTAGASNNFMGSPLIGLCNLQHARNSPGVAAFAVGNRRKEFGIRMALGAMRAQIIHLVLRSGARPICGGVLVGICLTLRASSGLAKLMKNAYFVLDTHDPSVYLVVCLLLMLSATVATLIPALRATGADPVHALREE